MNNESPFYYLTGSYNCRIQECEMSQNIVAPVAWMLAIMEYRPSMVIEIGTQRGGLSHLISKCTAYYGAEFHTMDIKEGVLLPKNKLNGNSTFHVWNCFDHSEEIKNLIQRSGQCFVLCDGGDKLKEFNTFSEFLKPGDVIAAHEYKSPNVENYDLYWAWFEYNPNGLVTKDFVDFESEWFKYSAWCTKQKIKL